MPTEILLTTGRQTIFADIGGDFGPDTQNDLQTGNPQASGQLTLASLATANAQSSDKVDLGEDRAGAYEVIAAVEFAAGVGAGNSLDLYWAPSSQSVALDGNPGRVSGSDAAYTGAAGNIDDGLKQLEFIGSFITTALPTASGVQIAKVANFSPGDRYGSLVLDSNAGSTLHSDDTECHVVFNPIIDEAQ